MFSFRRSGTVIAEGLRIIGNVAADGLVEVNGQIDGDLHCTSLLVTPKARIKGSVEANHVVVNGNVEGPIRGGAVTLKSQAVVVGDIETQSLAIERGAHFEGRSMRENGSNARVSISTSPKELADGRNSALDGAVARVRRPISANLEERSGPPIPSNEVVAQKVAKLS